MGKSNVENPIVGKSLDLSAVSETLTIWSGCVCVLAGHNASRTCRIWVASWWWTSVWCLQDHLLPVSCYLWL